ncbi:MAG: hypothetical protein H0U44_08325 [Flavisolibacter sp.]|nr:hypothetical protein [Flavisolibacter sp.]
MELLESQVFLYKEFKEGKVVFKDSVSTTGKLNYHRLFGQILFINQKGDTLALSKPETFDHVIIGTDTFFYYQKGYVQQLTHYPKFNLSLKQTLKYIGKEKKGAYGSYSATTSVNSVSDLNVNEPEMTRLYKADENSVYTFNNQFFIADRFNNLFEASKKNIFDIFSRHEKEMKNYIRINKIDLGKQRDLEKLMAFVHSVDQ